MNFLYRMGWIALVGAAVGAMPMYGAAVVQGGVFQSTDYTDFTQGHTIYNSPVISGPPLNETVSWSFTCTTCSGYGISASGAAKIINGTLGAVSSVTVTGSPTGTHYLAEANSYAQYTDTATITGGSGNGVLELQYALDGSSTTTGTGANSSFAYLAIFGAFGGGAYYAIDNGALTNGQQATFSGGGTKADTVTFYLPFTYGTPFSFEPIVRTAANFYLDFDSTTFTATWDYYNTATLNAALVLDGTASNPGSVVNGAVITGNSGLNYGPTGISTVPEPRSWLLLGSGMAVMWCVRRARPGGRARTRASAPLQKT